MDEPTRGGRLRWLDCLGLLLASLFLPFIEEEFQGFPAGSKASRHALEVPRREGRQYDLAVSRLEVHPRPLLDLAHGAVLLWDHDLAFVPTMEDSMRPIPQAS